MGISDREVRSECAGCEVVCLGCRASSLHANQATYMHRRIYSQNKGECIIDRQVTPPFARMIEAVADPARAAVGRSVRPCASLRNVWQVPVYTTSVPPVNKFFACPACFCAG